MSWDKGIALHANTESWVGLLQGTGIHGVVVFSHALLGWETGSKRVGFSLITFPGMRGCMMGRWMMLFCQDTK